MAPVSEFRSSEMDWFITIARTLHEIFSANVLEETISVH
ncbi:hypothetical protein D3OALGA1CA_3908 [Olavius algarvensis associated proteobacterium Delta 3]|nr:hypothetical protein D3OALGB2SA_2143 [Olavius algarvensis associated proteobacterium Delta 3]CAB5142049.1 hypothetical protein D3OALGA1CA_3908 [Olavius algarvensis associated proteobacterium Delta 3]